MKKHELINRVDYLIALGNSTFETKQTYDQTDYVESGMQIGFRTAGLSFIESLYKSNHIYYTEFATQVNGQYASATISGINILKAIKTEIENGWLDAISELISAEIFTDFLEMSSYLIKNKYKEAASVIIGAVLEERLRILCKKNNIETYTNKGNDIVPKKAETMNTELAKNTVYNILVQKNVTAWLDLRNKAAHGKFEEFTLKDVELMYASVLNFVSNY